jgi:trk system potassium uptake protein
MKRIVVIGLGNFGSFVAESLYTHGHDVIAIDMRENAVDRLANRVSRAAVGDARQIEILRQAGVTNCDAAIVSTGDDITASVLSTMALRDLGVSEIFVKVISHDHARVMKRLGATETVFPERETARNLAERLSAATLINYIRLGGGFGLQEMVVPSEWEGQTLRKLQLPVRYRISVVGIHDNLTDAMTVPPDPDAVLKQSDTLVVAGHDEALRQIASLD